MNGRINGINAYGVGTNACNIGDQTLLWEGGGSPRHPIIAQKMGKVVNLSHVGVGGATGHFQRIRSVLALVTALL